MIPLADIRSLPLTTLLGPFFAIIRSPLSTGPITSAALASLHSFFQCDLIRPDAVSLDACLSELSNTVSKCKFEASDTSGDEVTLLKIMTVVQDCMCGSVGDTLGDVEVCEMLETVLTTCCQMRLSGGFLSHQMRRMSYVLTPLIILQEILRRSAEGTMHALVKTAFARLHVLNPQEEEQRLADNDTQTDGESKLSVSASASSPTVVTTEEQEANKPPKESTVERAKCKPKSCSKFFVEHAHVLRRWLAVRSRAPSCSH